MDGEEAGKNDDDGEGYYNTGHVRVRGVLRYWYQTTWSKSDRCVEGLGVKVLESCKVVYGGTRGAP